MLRSLVAVDVWPVRPTRIDHGRNREERNAELMTAATGSFLSGLDGSERERFERRLEHRAFPNGSVILAEGDAPHEMYIIRSGEAVISIVDPFDVEHEISTVGPGDVIGEMSLLTGQPVSATVRATGDVEVFVLPDRDFMTLFAEFPATLPQPRHNSFDAPCPDESSIRAA